MAAVRFEHSTLGGSNRSFQGQFPLRCRSYSLTTPMCVCHYFLLCRRSVVQSSISWPSGTGLHAEPFPARSQLSRLWPRQALQVQGQATRQASVQPCHPWPLSQPSANPLLSVLRPVTPSPSFSARTRRIVDSMPVLPVLSARSTASLSRVGTRSLLVRYSTSLRPCPLVRRITVVVAVRHPSFAVR